MYAVFGLYENRPVNGRHTNKPHIVLTISQREMVNGSNKGLANRGKTTTETITQAALNGRLLDVDIKNRDDYAVTAQTINLGSISQTSLEKNIARFKEQVKTFKEKNRINYSKKDKPAVSAYTERYVTEIETQAQEDRAKAQNKNAAETGDAISLKKEQDTATNQYDTSGTHWAIKQGIVTRKDLEVFYQSIANLTKRGYYIPKTYDERDAMIDRLVYTSPGFAPYRSIKDNLSPMADQYGRIPQGTVPV